MRQTKLKSSKHHQILCMVQILTLLLTLLGNIPTNTFALEYQSNTNIQFTLNPTISVAISDNLAIDNLSPGTAKDSNVINVNVATNNVSGYTLSATVGNSTTNPSDELRHISYDSNNNNNGNSNNNYKFTSTSTNITELSNLEPNTWGYSYSTNAGSAWFDYSTLPLYTNTGTTLNSTTEASNDNIKFKIGAKASSTQAAGAYTNTINFYATTNQTPASFYDAFIAKHAQLYNGYYAMQDMDSSICNAVELIGPDSVTTLIDKRDGTTYKIAKLQDNNCWMLDNLALDLTDASVKAKIYDSTNPNHDTLTNATNTELGYLFNGGGTTADQYPTAKLNNEPWISSSQNYYSVPMIVTDYKDTLVTSYGPAATNGQAKVGIYYNYCAASAGTYCWGNGISSADSPTTDPKPDTLVDIDGDVCPANWRMPTSSDDGDYRTLCSAVKGSDCTIGDSKFIYMVATYPSSMQYQLSTSLSGFFSNGAVGYHLDVDGGEFWSSTRLSISNVYILYTNSTHVSPSSNYIRTHGRSVRCLLN